MLNLTAFKSPAKKFREVPFWSWNDWLEIPELVRQIGEMDDAGWGGFFMHARGGRETPYLGTEWMACVKACVVEAKKRGMHAWLYDEDKWPSGFGGGAVPKLSPAYREKALRLREHGIPDRPECVKVLGVYSAVKRGGRVLDLKAIPKDKTDAERRKGQTIFYIYQWTAPLEVPRFNGTSYVDTLNPQMTQAFIASTHAKYKRVVGDQFGKTVPGIFTDEPSCMDGPEQRLPAVPWTTGFPTYFKKLNGYTLTPHLPSLFFQVGDWRKIRYDFRRTIQRRFVESYSKPIGEWCERNNLKSTGHYLIEEDFKGQITFSGGGVMPHYEYMQYPGIDHLGWKQIHPTLAKQVASVASQLGKERVLSELYGCSGHRSSFEDRKWLADWHFVHGVNLLNPHLSLYSMRGERKRDYPPNIYYQQPYWKHNRVLSDYIGRIAYALTQGRRVVDVLVLNTIESAWMDSNGYYTTDRIDELDGQFKRVQDILLSDQRDYEIGDEELLLRHGVVRDGALTVGDSSYAVVVLPPLTVLRETTVRLLEEFVANGGSLIAVRPTATYVEGVKDARRVNALLKSSTVVDLSPAPLRNAIDAEIPRSVSVRARGNRRVDDIHVHQRNWSETDLYFFTNCSRTRAQDVAIHLRGPGKLTLWDTRTGARRALPAVERNGYIVFNARLETAGSLLVSRELGKSPAKPSVAAKKGKAQRRLRLSGDWKLRRLDPNALTLDTCRYQFLSTTRWSEELPAWKVQEKLKKNAYGTFGLRYSFEAKSAPRGKCHLVMECPELFVVSINGQWITPLSKENYYRDTYFRMLDITGKIRSGTNVIEMHAPGMHGHRVESCYIIGEFAVTNRANRHFALTTEKKTSTGVDLVKDGYPFYAGSFDFTRTFSLTTKPQSAQIRFGRMNFIHAEVFVNGRKAGAAYWSPLTVDVARHLKRGRNEIRIRLTNSLRNLLGPHHQKTGDQNWTGPAEFVNEKNWTDRYDLHPFGLSGVELVYS